MYIGRSCMIVYVCRCAWVCVPLIESIKAKETHIYIYLYTHIHTPTHTYIYIYIYISDGPDVIFLTSADANVYADTEILTSADVDI